MNFADRLFVVSPHLDDAVLGCGLTLAAHSDANVSTAFTAAPEHDMTTDWDRDPGFAGVRGNARTRSGACRASPIHYLHDPVQTTKTGVHGAINLVGLAKRVMAKILQASTMRSV
ncbi:hypothetical protein bAD24_p01230 (plasmid) [Burkholderia sp. AD24]|nr:hypothetical protein bAD24_p01230 [Burkholderia sp. AD24]